MREKLDEALEKYRSKGFDHHSIEMRFPRLTDKQKTYAEALRMGLTEKQAAIAADYSDIDQALYQNRRHKVLQDYINERMQSEVKDTETTVKWRLQILKKIAERGSDGSTANMFNSAIGSISEINKMCGDYAPVKQISANANVNVDAPAAEIEHLIESFAKDY